MHKLYIQTACILGAFSVALGAFGSHALKKMATPETVAVFETGVRYQFYHVFALLATGLLYAYFPNTYINWAGKLFITGIICFSGSLYLLTIKQITGSSLLGWVGPITPIGGLQLIVAWILLFVGLNK